MAYTAMQQQLDEGFPAGQHNYWRSHFLTGIPDEAIDTVVDHFLRSPSPMNAVLFEQLGGAVARVGRDETAFNHRDAAFNLLMVARWVEPDQAEVNIAWVRGLSEAMRPFAEGVYVNYLGVGEQADRVRAAYGAEKYDRLVELKNRYDPTNRFCFNQNITPTI
jgi:FAD/FMN-containing dehydrogenase